MSIVFIMSEFLVKFDTPPEYREVEEGKCHKMFGYNECSRMNISKLKENMQNDTLSVL